VCWVCDERIVVLLGFSDALLIGGNGVRTGPPPSYQKLKGLIEKWLKKLQLPCNLKTETCKSGGHRSSSKVLVYESRHAPAGFQDLNCGCAARLTLGPQTYG
jgi:hypothetical protein